MLKDYIVLFDKLKFSFASHANTFFSLSETPPHHKYNEIKQIYCITIIYGSILPAFQLGLSLYIFVNRLPEKCHNEAGTIFPLDIFVMTKYP